MEALDEHERYEGKVLPRDLPPLTEDQIALAALIDAITRRVVQGHE